MNNNVNDIFWLSKPSILLDTYLQFIPTRSMTTIQRYNAITLFCIYSIILIIVFGKSLQFIFIPIVLISMIIVLNSLNNTNKHEKFNNIIETGYIDSNNDVRFNRVTGVPTIGSDVTYSCRPPTVDNPFMNPPVSDFNTVVPVACNSDDENINNDITKAFTSDLYMDVDDVFEKMNSQRQFYTVPNTSIPSNQEDFANWLYKTPVTCKEDQEQCLRYEDLRYKR